MTELRPRGFDLRDLTNEIVVAIESGDVTVIRSTTVYTTDRPGNEEHPGFLGARGNSEVEAGHTFDISRVMLALAPQEPSRLRMSQNSVRIFEQIPATGVLHYHGYSKHYLAENPLARQVLIFTVNGMGAMIGDRTVSIPPKGVSGTWRTAVIFERNDRIEVEELGVGDMVILPSGRAHTLSTTSGCWASYSVIELADNPEVMYQTHWFEEEGEQLAVERWIENSNILRGDREVDLGSISEAKDFVKLGTTF
ncbi:MAG: hypothetical protein ACFHX7_22005 [Pseudomonadota bacterium]